MVTRQPLVAGVVRQESRGDRGLDGQASTDRRDEGVELCDDLLGRGTRMSAEVALHPFPLERPAGGPAVGVLHEARSNAPGGLDGRVGRCAVASVASVASGARRSLLGPRQGRGAGGSARDRRRPRRCGARRLAGALARHGGDLAGVGPRPRPGRPGRTTGRSSFRLRAPRLPANAYGSKSTGSSTRRGCRSSRRSGSRTSVMQASMESRQGRARPQAQPAGTRSRIVSSAGQLIRTGKLVTPRPRDT